MTIRPIVYSDLDYTIIFDSVLHPETERLLTRLRERALFIIVTARSYAECAPLPPIPNDGIITENGAGIFRRVDGGDVLCPDWDRQMSARQETLDTYRDMLENQGWVIHYKPRAFSTNVEGSGKTDADVEAAVAALPEGLQLQFSRNTAGRYLEVFPLEAGKDKALRRICLEHGVPLEQSFALGDNANDMDMLKVAGHAFAPGNCHPDVRALLQQIGGYVSPEEGHAGAQDILRKVMAHLG